MQTIITTNPASEAMPAMLVSEHTAHAISAAERAACEAQGIPFVAYAELPCALRWRLMQAGSAETVQEILHRRFSVS